MARVITSCHSVEASLASHLRSALAMKNAPPALVVGVARVRPNESLVNGAMVAEGLCERGSTATVNVESPFHLGSCTKSMTGMLAVLLAREGKLDFDAPIEHHLKSFPVVHPSWNNVTMRQLLAHRAGISDVTQLYGLTNGKLVVACLKILFPLATFVPRQADLLWDPLRESDRLHTPNDAVHIALSQALTRPSASVSPSSEQKFHYSNLGYGVAGWICGKVSGEAKWQDALAKYVFEPLGMTKAGFGQPIEASHPKGHPNSVPVPWVLAPAGDVHTPVSDWLKFLVATVDWQRDEALRPLLAPYGGSVTRLVPCHYGAGWMVLDGTAPQTNFGKMFGQYKLLDQVRKACDSPVKDLLLHTGSDGRWFSTCLVDVNNGLIACVAANEAGRSTSAISVKLLEQAVILAEQL